MPEGNQNIKVNWSEVAKALGEGVVASIKGLAEAADADLQTFGIGIGNDLVTALQEPNPETREALKKELVGQARALAELNRIRVNAAAWDHVQTVLTVASTIGEKLLQGLLVGALAVA